MDTKIFNLLEIFKESNNQKLVKTKLYHASTAKFNTLKKQPTWFSFTMDQGLAWANAIVEENGHAYLYQCNYSGITASYHDLNIKQLFKDHNKSLIEYMNELSENPKPSDILKIPETKLLISNGYDSFINKDYDPSDFSKDSDTFVTFFPNNNINNFKMIKSLL